MTKKKVKQAAPPKSKWAEPLKSPIPAYPGTVSLPEHFTMSHFRAWSKANDKLSAIDIDVSRYGSSPSYHDEGEFDAFDPLAWGHVLALATINLEGFPAKALTDDSGESTPFEVLAWLIPIVRNEYLPEKLNLKNSLLPRTTTGQEQ